MDLHLRSSEISAVRRLLLADAHPENLLDDDALQALMQLVPCDAMGTGEGAIDGVRLRGTDVPHGVHDDLGNQPCEGLWMTGLVHLAALPPDDEDVQFQRRIGVRDNLWVGFPTVSGTVVQIYLERRKSFFTERDLAILAMLEPALGRVLRSRPRIDSTPLLTPTERRVLELVAAGASNRQAAEDLYVSVATIRKHLENSYRKLGVRSRTGAVAALS